MRSQYITSSKTKKRKLMHLPHNEKPEINGHENDVKSRNQGISSLNFVAVLLFQSRSRIYLLSKPQQFNP